MKNALLVVNGLLVIAVGFLLYKQFSGSPDSKGPRAGDVLSKDKDSMLNKKVLFAYIDMDTLQEKYIVAKNAQDEIRKKQNEMNASLEAMQKALRTKVAGYQQQGNNMTEEQYMAAKQDVDASQQQFLEKQKNLTDEYNNFVNNKISAVKKKIEDYLKVFNADKTFSFIFSYEPGLFYYKDTAYDITKEVLKGLNDQYANEKK
ncbi:outer membrane chaperone Skp [Niabella ginsenosidivorans]|uniref:Outer membrane chaperone Skp n=1 Tax=Niabella ginsenosidivorans TaxID=1176587 RepID=A0A1A9I3Z1_9BACT|nr:OmpH family outer membrane protein [Niabella ginsenosidivorans]ANH82263.1 outer membrane chaperone Skp [Niabella ginsenosidivorans]